MQKQEQGQEYWSRYALGEIHAIRRVIHLCIIAISAIAGKEAILKPLKAAKAAVKAADPSPGDGFGDGFDGVLDEMLSHLSEGDAHSERSGEEK